MSQLIDISPRVSERIGVWPGDVAYRRQVSLRLAAGDNIELSAISSTVHLGAHADAPCHYQLGGEGIAARPLHLYYGPCQVIEVALERNTRILPRDLPHAVSAPRVLFKTGSFPNPERFSEDFNALSVELVRHLQEAGVLLVGIDTPSIDLFADKELETHQEVGRHGLAVLEGLALERVVPGHYTLIALPLALEDADASPVRAVLVDDRRGAPAD